MRISKDMPYVIFFKKVNKRSIVNYENENFYKYLLDFKKKLTTDKSVRISYRRKNNNMGVVNDIKVQMGKMNAILEQLLENKKSQGQTGNDAAPVEGIPVDAPAVIELYKGFTKYLQDEGFISKKPLDKRNTDNGNAAPTPDETPASVKGPVTVLYGLRKLKEKIANANFVVENLPAFNAVATGPNTWVGNASLDSWRAQDVSNIRTQYEKLAEVVRELKSLMGPLSLDI